jgi:hypothetical protein
MAIHDDSPGGLLRRARRAFSRTVPAQEECTHPHARRIEADGDTITILVCEQCGRRLDVPDPALLHKQRLPAKRVCIECGGTYSTIGTHLPA